jgi:hypothetical protein
MEHGLASELLHEVNANAKRWFIAFCVMVGLEIATIIGFMWYISLPVEEGNITQESDDSSDNYIVGGDYNGSSTDSKLQKKSSP